MRSVGQKLLIGLPGFGHDEEMERGMEDMVRVYRPEARWIVLLAAQLRATDPLRDRAFRMILEGRGADHIPLSEARRLRL